MNTVTGPLAMETSFSVKNELGTKPDWAEMEIYPVVLDMVARLSTRIFLGQELCRNDVWLEVTKTYTTLSTSSARVLRTWPRFLWPVVCHFYEKYRRVRDISRRSQQLITGVVEARRRQRADCRANGVPAPEYNDVLAWAEEEAGSSPYDPAVIQLTLSFAATHTTSDLVAQIMVRLAAAPDLIEPLRKEAVEVLGAEGWSKQSLYKLKLMDSALKETQRLKPINNCRLPEKRSVHPRNLASFYMYIFFFFCLQLARWCYIVAMQRFVLEDTELQGGVAEKLFPDIKWGIYGCPCFPSAPFPMWSCGLCDRDFPSQEAFQQHLRIGLRRRFFAGWLITPFAIVARRSKGAHVRFKRTPGLCADCGAGW